MLVLRFQLGEDVLELDARDVVEVIPCVELQRVPHAPDYVAGLLNYRGRPVPVIDLCWLSLQRASRPLLSTRIILVRHDAAISVDGRLGLMAERVTEAADGSVSTSDEPSTERRRVTVDDLLPISVREVLFVGS